jgi:hypothetical protein
VAVCGLRKWSSIPDRQKRIFVFRPPLKQASCPFQDKPVSVLKHMGNPCMRAQVWSQLLTLQFAFEAQYYN